MSSVCIEQCGTKEKVMIKTVLCLIIVLFGGCALDNRKSGHVSPAIFSMRNGVTTKEDVQNALGTPITFSAEPDVWHYVQIKRTLSSVRKPRVEDVYFCTFIFKKSGVLERIIKSDSIKQEKS